MIEELETYIASRGPKARRFLTRAAKDMSEEQQRNFLGSLQLGDTEFQAEVAPYMPKGAKINPSRARLETFSIQEVDERASTTESCSCLDTRVAKSLTRQSLARLVKVWVQSRIVVHLELTIRAMTLFPR